jgi:hypothetical protein
MQISATLQKRREQKLTRINANSIPSIPNTNTNTNTNMAKTPSVTSIQMTLRRHNVNRNRD